MFLMRPVRCVYNCAYRCNSVSVRYNCAGIPSLLLCCWRANVGTFHHVQGVWERHRVVKVLLNTTGAMMGTIRAVLRNARALSHGQCIVTGNGNQVQEVLFHKNRHPHAFGWWYSTMDMVGVRSGTWVRRLLKGTFYNEGQEHNSPLRKAHHSGRLLKRNIVPVIQWESGAQNPFKESASPTSQRHQHKNSSCTRV